MQENLFVICCSRGRPKRCLEMIQSFKKTASRASLKIYLDMCDPALEEYRDLISKEVSFTVGFRKPTTQIINENWQHSADCFKYFSVTNDDFIYKTSDWDSILIGELKSNGGQGIVFGNDLMNGVRLPTTSIVSREIVEALGWLQMPRLTHLFGDTVWQHIGKKAGCLFYREDVIIKHCHFEAREYEKDDTYKETNSSRMYDIDQLALLNWLDEESFSDIEKVKLTVEKYKSK